MLSSKKKRKQSKESSTLINKKAKKTKKKSLIPQKKESISSLCNVVGITENGDELDPFANVASASMPSQHVNEDLDDCLALMDQSIYGQNIESNISKVNTKDAKSIEHKGKESNELISKQNVLWKGQNASLNIICNSNHTKSLSSQTALKDFSLPNIQIELARHKQMGDLSQYLLSKCPKLRMPSFERWLIDSKLEERAKRNFIEETNQKIQMAEETARNHQHYSKKNKELKWKQRLKRKRDELKTSLDRHLTSSGMRTMNDYDHVIPAMADIEDEASRRLLQEIESSLEGNDGDDDMNEDHTIKAKSICKELCQKACSAGRQVQNLNQHLGGPIHINQYFPSKKDKKSASHSIGKILLKTENDSEGTDSKDSSSMYSLVYSRKNKKGPDAKPFVVKINSQHYEKLRVMFHSIHDGNDKMRVLPTKSLRREKDYDSGTKVFLHLVFCLLVRYASLSGGQQLLDLRGGGMQGAIHSQVFDALSDFSGSESIIECFASPLNVYSNQYCSIFHQDIDYHFGSVGDFFTLPLGHFTKQDGKIHEANPPFAPGLMGSMVERLEEHLEYADMEAKKSSTNGELSFVVVVPTCMSNKRSNESSGENMIHNFASESFRKMTKSQYFSKHIILNAREHGYVEGSQHLRQTRYKESQYNTSVVILQSKKSKELDEANPTITTSAFEDIVRKAFASLHSLETEERRSNPTNKKVHEKTSKHEKKKSKKRKS